MYTNTLSKFGLFGKIGKVIMTALSVIAALITVSCCILTAFIATLPEDALSVRVDEHTELHFGTENFWHTMEYSWRQLYLFGRRQPGVNV